MDYLTIIRVLWLMNYKQQYKNSQQKQCTKLIFFSLSTIDYPPTLIYPPIFICFIKFIQKITLSLASIVLSLNSFQRKIKGQAIMLSIAVSKIYAKDLFIYLF